MAKAINNPIDIDAKDTICFFFIILVVKENIEQTQVDRNNIYMNESLSLQRKGTQHDQMALIKRLKVQRGKYKNPNNKLFEDLSTIKLQL